MSEEEYIYIIGNDNEEYLEYLKNNKDINYLPIKNLPAIYFPFYYNNNEISIEKLKRLIPLTDADTDANLDNLFTSLINIEDKKQPYNNNNIFHIRIALIFFWIIMFFIILKLMYIILLENYAFYILLLIGLFLLFCVIWSFIFTRRYL
jgi:hypothetical protein